MREWQAQKWRSVREMALLRLTPRHRWEIARATAERALERLQRWDESQHPREPAGSPDGGQFTSGGGGGGGGGSAQEAPAKLDPAVVNVGGDKWNQETAERLEREYQAARPAMDKLAKEAVGKEIERPQGDDEDENAPFVPEEWEQVDAHTQEKAEEEYISKSTDDYYDWEVQNWNDEYALDDAKSKVSEDFNQSPQQWAMDALNDLRSDREEAGKADIPFTNTQLLEAMTIDYENQGGSWPKKDPQISFDDEKLTEPTGYDPAQQTLPGIEPVKPHEMLTEDMREAIGAVVLNAFNKEAENVQGDLEPPEYLKDSASESASEGWSSMDDDDKFKWTKNNTSLLDDSSDDTEQTIGQKLKVDALPTKFDPLDEGDGGVEDYKRTQALARHLSIERAAQVMEQRGIKDVDKGEILRIDNQLWSEWKSSSTSWGGKVLQIAIADELGGRLYEKQLRGEAKQSLIDEVNHDYKSTGGYKGLLAYVRAKWETTQYLLDKAGEQTLNLYRGISLEKADFNQAMTKVKIHRLKSYLRVIMKMVGGYEHLPDLHVVRNGAASTTTDATVANDWSAHQTRVVLRAQVPRTAAVSVPAYGINVHSEHEVVVAGTAWKGWDAWAHKAPGFEHVKLAA